MVVFGSEETRRYGMLEEDINDGKTYRCFGCVLKVCIALKGQNNIVVRLVRGAVQNLFENYHEGIAEAERNFGPGTISLTHLP